MHWRAQINLLLILPRKSVPIPPIVSLKLDLAQSGLAGKLIGLCSVITNTGEPRMRASASLAKYSELNLPRYTSYPTAPHFGADIDGGVYRDWISGLPKDDAVSLYVHVPFCRSMCWYCGCHTKITRRDEPIERYVAALNSEIASLRDVAGAKLRIGHIHFGGGTPTIIGPQNFIAIMGAIRRHFDIDEGAEIAVEIDPRTLDAAMAEALGGCGVNRASLGIQSFDEKVQMAVNRIQPFEQTRHVIEALRGVGVEHFNFDLIYGLPLQTVESCIETARLALQLEPGRFSVFGYAHVPSFKKHQQMIPMETLPDTQERLQQAEAIAKFLRGAGYVQIGLDHFALPQDELAIRYAGGSLRRNFQGYTSDPCETLIGLGASAIGKLPQGFVQNDVAIERYCERLASGSLATAKGYRFTGDDKVRAEIIERLMCDFTVDLDSKELKAKCNPRLMLDANPELQQLIGEGLVHRVGNRITVNSEARFLIRKVASCFDAYLGVSGRTFSKAS